MMADTTLSDLRDALVDAYPEMPRAREIAERAGIVRGTLPPNLPMRDWWWEAIQSLQRQGKLIALVDAAIADPTVAGLKPRFEALRNLIAQSQGPAVHAQPDEAAANEAERPAVRGEELSRDSVQPPAPVVPAMQPDLWIITEPIHMELVRVVDDRPLLMGTPPGQKMQMLGMFEGAKAEWFNDEQPATKVTVAPFAIGRYPVTNAQYAVFVNAAGHEAPSHWDWGTAPPGREDHPVVNVSWHDAVAFTKWLSARTGRSFRLPTEAEWEKAARGTDGRVYPWGVDWDAKKANTGAGGPGETTPVGQYSPGGDSPYRCADMAGNVWEWTSSLYQPYPYKLDDGREDPKAQGARVLRGGSFSDNARRARSAYRLNLNPDYRLDFGGFRVAVSPGL